MFDKLGRIDHYEWLGMSGGNSLRRTKAKPDQRPFIVIETLTVKGSD
jgi:hypothetical protein